jgi:hypothetical protein
MKHIETHKPTDATRRTLWIILFCLLYLVGFYAKEQTAFSYLHEWGHVFAANQSGIGAEITSRTTTRIDGPVTYSILVGGFWTEMIVWSALAFLFCSFRWPATGALAGFCYGFQLSTYIFAQRSQDFSRAGAFAYTQWRFWGGLILFALYVHLTVRLIKWYEEAALDASRNHRTDAKQPDTKQGTSTDLR